MAPLESRFRLSLSMVSYLNVPLTFVNMSVVCSLCNLSWLSYTLDETNIFSNTLVGNCR